MAFTHGLLALLAEQPSYAWQLKRRVESILGADWASESRSWLYETLKRLEKDGLISTTRIPTGDLRPDVRMHEITDAGRAELEQWLDRPTTRTAGFRDDFSVKVLAAALRGVEEIHRVCDLQRDA